MPENEKLLKRIKKKSVHSLLFLSFRNLFVQSIGFLGFFLLSIYLDQPQMGLFAAVSEIVAILGYFSDIGLAAALIQKKKKPRLSDIRTTFTIQQILVFTLLSLLFILSFSIPKIRDLDLSGRHLLYALMFGFFTSSLKTIPSVLLERSLRFDILSIIDFVEITAFNLIAVFLAWRGWGTTSYVWAVIARSILGLLVISILKPWPIGFAFHKKSINKLFKFGVPYQLNSLLATVKDRLSNVFMWGIVGSTGIGITSWAQKWSQFPLRFLMDAVMRVTFPGFSRLQKDKEHLKLAIEKSIFYISAFTFPALILMCFAIVDLTKIIPKYEKWQVALLALFAYSINSLLASITTPITNAFNAVGKIKITFRLMLVWTALTWTVLPLLAYQLGYNGIAIFQVFIGLTSFYVWYLAQKHLSVDVLKSIRQPLFSTFFIIILLVLLHAFFSSRPLLNLLLKLSFGSLTYALLIYFTAKKEIIWFVNTFFASFKKSQK
jgi:O-antigen/teichoic acid export membrane protein